MIVPNVIYSTVANKCPRCHHGKMFENNNPYSFENGLKMKASCSECGLVYEKETGFFYGALYVSYGLMAGLFIVWYTIDALWLHLDPVVLFAIVLSNILILFPVAFRWARTLWLNFFVRYDKSYKNKKKEKTEPTHLKA